MTGKQLWGGRFTGKTDPLMVNFNASIHFDKRMASVDCRGSHAYAGALLKKGLLTQQECDSIQQGLNVIAEEWATGKFELDANDEDIHTANERRLGQLIGKTAGKLHTGRSRNDQVATDLRMYMRESILELRQHLVGLISVAVSRAEQEIDILMPGYTHLQRAQPIRWSHWLMNYSWFWHSDLERLDSMLQRLNQCPLGSGALAGNPFEIDRHDLAKELGFESCTPNSMYSVSDRDFIAEFLFWSSLTMVHLSRFSEDLVNYCTAEFGFITLADAYSTGSSLMPQKKNPDSLELIRGKSGRVFGDMAGFLMTYKGLASTYNKDLQEDKEPAFDAIDTLNGCIQISTGVLSTLTVNAGKMHAALSIDMLATDLAEYLVRKGVPFRESHHIAGAVVKLAEDRNYSMAEIPLTDLMSLNSMFAEDVAEIWNFEKSVETRCSFGGTSRDAVLEQVQLLKSKLINK